MREGQLGGGRYWNIEVNGAKISVIVIDGGGYLISLVVGLFDTNFGYAFVIEKRQWW